MHRHNEHLRDVSGEPERANAQALTRKFLDNPFLTPPEAFVKDPSTYISPSSRAGPGEEFGAQ